MPRVKKSVRPTPVTNPTDSTNADGHKLRTADILVIGFGIVVLVYVYVSGQHLVDSIRKQQIKDIQTAVQQVSCQKLAK